MILYIRDIKGTVSYYQVDTIHVENTIVSFTVNGKYTDILKKEICFASLRTEDGRLLQIVKE